MICFEYEWLAFKINKNPVTRRVRQELDYMAGNRNGTRIPVPVNQNRNGFQEFRFRLIRNGYNV